MLATVLLLLNLSANQYLSDLEVTPLSFDAEVFREAFNQAADRPRLVVVVSPTCGHCLQLASDVQDVLSRQPQSRLKVFVLWEPYMSGDTRASAQRAASFLADSRVVHYWDLWRYGARVYSAQLGIPAMEAWDMLVFYKPHLVWKESPPEPTFWMQNRGLQIGTPYAKDAFEKEILQWAR